MAPVATWDGPPPSSNGTAGSGNPVLPIGNTGISLVGPAEILAVDLYALLIGQASHLYTFPRDLNNVWGALSQGDWGAAANGIAVTALDLLVPRYGHAGGSGWGVSGNDHTLGTGFNFALNRTDQGSFDHDRHDNDWQWIADQLRIGGSGRASGPFALEYKLIGSIGFGISGFRN